jgi:hypothetical protein
VFSDNKFVEYRIKTWRIRGEGHVEASEEKRRTV